jgi:hypothetical protein
MKTLDIPSSNIKLCNVFNLVNADGPAKIEAEFRQKKKQTCVKILVLLYSKERRKHHMRKKWKGTHISSVNKKECTGDNTQIEHTLITLQITISVSFRKFT